MAEYESINEYQPDLVTAPGETLLEILEDRDMSQAELAERMGRPKKTINEIIKAKASITPETAIQLSRVLGTSSTFWMNLESNYRSHLAEKEDLERIQGEYDWLRRFPVPKLMELGWISKTQDKTQQVRNLLSFFAVASKDQWSHVYELPQASFRRSTSFESDSGALSCWLRRGALLAEQAHCSPFSRTRFRSVIHSARSLSQEPIDVAVPKLAAMCAEAGVALVFVRQLPKVPVSGATYWVSQNLAVIQLTFRYKTDDHLWFTFFHEAGHILLHGKKQIFLEGDDEKRLGEEEEEANRFAADTLIPPAQLKRLLRSKPISKAKIVHFASSIGVSPGIVVGRLQHEGELSHTHLNALKAKYDWGSLESYY